MNRAREQDKQKISAKPQPQTRSRQETLKRCEPLLLTAVAQYRHHRLPRAASSSHRSSSSSRSTTRSRPVSSPRVPDTVDSRGATTTTTRQTSHHHPLRFAYCRIRLRALPVDSPEGFACSPSDTVSSTRPAPDATCCSCFSRGTRRGSYPSSTRRAHHTHTPAEPHLISSHLIVSYPASHLISRS